ncbi:MAG TPA: glycosyltransferase family 4 protein [Bryobacteraceae bacterium]|jgi:hypothetical protein|nr:glycosyltransferase family 4 protein [Bryobacteraceae bacterium]
MRILHLDSGKEMRGGQWQVLRLAAGLAREGVESVLLAPAGSSLSQRAVEAGLAVRPLSLLALARCSREADLTHAHDARCHTWAAALSTAPLIVARRVAFPIRSRWKYARAARYIAISQNVRGVLIAGGVPEEKIDVVYDGVPLPPPGRALRGADFAVVAPASEDPQKGSDLVREAAGMIPIGVHFSSDLEADLARASLFVYLTRSEGLGSGVLLAMAAGVPVIASRVGGLPEILSHGENGWLTPNDPAAVAEAIRTLLEDRALAQRLAAAGRRTVEERFTVETMVRQTIAVYRRVLA